ncbi:MAG: DUF6259 domain-containing protein, partial [Kiritimatiellae bacterium]|nr:DUF6259 domain-containing protein [Kiritimatiellia bacterium]
ADNTRFVRTRPAAAGLWSLTFKTPPDAEGRQEAVELTNRSQPRTRKCATSRRGLTFEWQGLDLPGEAGAVDVRAEVRIAPGAGASEWRITVKNRSRRFGLWETDYPRLTGVVPPGLADVLLPRGNWGGSLMPRHAGQYDGRYPSFACPVQLAAFNLGEAGLYLAAHDGDANAKRLVVTREQDFTFKALAENAGVPGAAGAPDYPLVIAAYKGDWWQAAKRYRAWALRQPWTSKGPIRERSDYPRRLTDLGFWMLLNGHPASVSDAMSKTALLYPDIPLGVHWYNWHEIPFDHSYPEYFPAKPGVAEAARAMEAAGQTVMPYINARLWDRDIPSFTEALPATCKQPSGTNYVETYGSGRYLAPMCPDTELWQQRIYGICASLIDKYNMGAIYLDQIGSAAPVYCFDPTHGHPTGGGSHWVDGYRTMMRSIKAAAVKRKVALTTEDSAEPYMDNIDGCLAWNPRHQEDVPLLPAVYSGYTIYFTSPQSASDSLDAFCAAQARDFLWGCQLGWNDPWILQEPHREKQAFQYELCRYRLAAKEFMVFGELLDELRPEQAPEQAVHLWHRHQPHNARLPIVMGTLWRDAAGRLAAFVVNTSGHPKSFSFKVETARWSKCQIMWRISLLTTEGEESLREGQSNSLIMGDLKPREIRAFIFTPAAE